MYIIHHFACVSSDHIPLEAPDERSETRRLARSTCRVELDDATLFRCTARKSGTRLIRACRATSLLLPPSLHKTCKHDLSLNYSPQPSPFSLRKSPKALSKELPPSSTQIFTTMFLPTLLLATLATALPTTPPTNYTNPTNNTAPPKPNKLLPPHHTLPPQIPQRQLLPPPLRQPNLPLRPPLPNNLPPPPHRPRLQLPAAIQPHHRRHPRDRSRGSARRWGVRV